MKLPSFHRPRVHLPQYDRLALQTAMELVIGAVAVVMLLRWIAN